MDFNEYQNLASRTANINASPHDRILYSCLGLTGEAGEFVDAYKKIVAHGHTMDEDKLKKELGDVLWYLADLCSNFGWSLDEVAKGNILKLAKRYPQAFNKKDSIDRKE